MSDPAPVRPYASASVGARLDRLLGPDGRTVIVALDHALATGQAAGLDDPAGVLAEIADAGADAAILTPGAARLRAGAAGALPWLLTADYYATSVDAGTPGDEELHGVLWSAEHAAALGADGIKCLWIHGQTDPERHLRSLRQVARLMEDAHRAGLPVMVEAVLWGPRLAPGFEQDGELVANAARMAFELGADLIKVAMPHDATSLQQVARSVPVPIVAMGGPAHDPRVLFTHVRRVLDAGLAGVALGRNVWKAERPERMVAALRALVHDGASDADALALLRQGGGA